MAETKTMRLGKAAGTYNVSSEKIVEVLRKAGFVIENNPNSKITAEMIPILDREFGTDKAIKQQAESTKIEKPKSESIVMTVDTMSSAAKKKNEDQELLIKNNIIHKEPEKEEFIPTEKVQLTSPKVIDKIDLGKATKSTKKQSPDVTEVTTEKTEPDGPEKSISDDQEDKIETQYQKLTGPKTVGVIDLSKFEEKRKEEAAPKRKETGTTKKRERIKKRERAAPIEDDKYYDKKIEDFQRRRESKKAAEAAQTPAISEKEIEEKIRATMAKIQALTSKSDRQKIRRGKREDQREKQELAQSAQTNKLKVTEFMTVSELASLMNVPPVQVIQNCMQLGLMVSINQRLDAEVIGLVASENGFEVEFQSVEENTAFAEEETDKPEDLQPRAPIVTIMGHVDHGKTSLLDYIRKANVVAKEAGGITQHIGAYEVTTAGGRKITFLDTPGHEAFTAMRARGAKVTDVAVIVIAADDAVMPQTREAISHAQSAGVPMIFAFNKIDKEGANPDKIREQLANLNLLVEEWGGKYQSQEISAKKGINIDALLEKILIEADLLDLKANPNKRASGSVIEATLDKGRGYTATLLVQSGTLHKGDIVVSGPYYGRVKAMFDHQGERIEHAGPSTPVQILGLNGAPQAGEKFRVFENEQEAKEIANRRAQLERETGLRTKKHITLDEIGRRLALGNFKELNLIIKGDVDGSVEALTDSLQKLSTEQIAIKIVLKGVGQISEADVNLASATDAIIIGFNVRPSANAKKLAEQENIEIKLYSVIYNAIEDVKNAMEGLLEPKIEEKVIGNLDVKETFHISKVGTVAGCFVREGRILRSSKVRVIRDGIVIHNGSLASLKRFKDDVKEVVSGMECGVQIKDFQDIKTGDVIEVYEETEVTRKL
ncbi:MAG: translation initiation factor IF-2 [Chitinophagales bacterium]|nr:translation initiation factor IF-2 [Chitinophagales bacterium]